MSSQSLQVPKSSEAESSGRDLSVGILLSGKEKFSPYYGGALARWTYEVYSRLTGDLHATTFGFPTAAADLYPLRHQTSSSFRVCNLLARVPRVRRYEDHLWLWSLMSRLRSLDVVHIHNRPQWIRLLRQFGYSGKLVLHLQNDHLGHWDAASLDRLAPQLDAVVVCSSYLRDTFAPRSAAIAAKANVIFNGVNTQLFFPREELRQPKTILFTGRFSAEKGVLELVKAFDIVRRTHPDARLKIVGTPLFGMASETPYVRQVRDLARSLFGDNNAQVEFVGYVHHDRDLPAYFQQAAIFSSPSIFQEPFGLVNAEAMACATPVVGSNRGGIPEVLGDTGIVIDPENIAQYADALCTLLAQPELCSKLGRLTRERCLHMFDWSVIAKQWIGFLQALVRNKQVST